MIQKNALQADRTYHRGEIYLVGMNSRSLVAHGTSQPVIVLQNNTVIDYYPVLIVAPLITCDWKANRQRITDYALKETACLKHDSAIALDRISTIDRRCVKKYLGKISPLQMEELEAYIMNTLGLYISEEMETP